MRAGFCYPPPIESVRSKRAAAAAACLIVAAAGAVRLGGLGRSSYWLDEIFESFSIHGSWNFLLSQLRRDAVHPPLDYAVLRILEPLHPSDPVRKIPEAVWGIGAVVAAGALVRRRGGTPAALLGAAILALSPVHVRYSQELRPYSLGIFLVLASLLALDAWLDRPSPGRAALFFLGAAATAYTLTLAAVSLAVGAAALALEDAATAKGPRRESARRLWRWSPAVLLALALVYLPWLPIFARGVRGLSPGHEKGLTISRAGHLLSELTLSYKYGGFSFGPPRFYHGVFAIYLGMAALGAAVCLRRPGLRFLAAWSAFGMLAIEILRRRSPGHFASRYFLPAGVSLPLLAGVGLAWLFSRRLGRAPAAAALAALLLMEGAALGLYYREGRADWRPIARLLSRTGRRPIFTDNENSRMCLAYYLCGEDWLARGQTCDVPITNVHGSAAPIEEEALRGRPSWLVLSGMRSARRLREWSRAAPSISFPEAEGVTLRRIARQAPPERNAAAVAAIPSRRGT